jgi:hypothetical protein
MNSGVAAGAPTDSLRETAGMIRATDNDGAGSRQLRMAFEAQIDITLDEKLVVDRSVRLVTRGATFSKRLMFKDMRPRLLPVALKTDLVLSTHKGSLGQEDVFPMGIMTADTGQATLPHWVVVLKVEKHFLRWMALKTGGGISSRIDYRFPSPSSRLYVKAARAVTGLTAQNLSAIFQGNGEPGMIRIFEVSNHLFMASGTGFHAHVVSSGNGEGRTHYQALLCPGAGKEENQHRHANKA